MRFRLSLISHSLLCNVSIPNRELDAFPLIEFAIRLLLTTVSIPNRELDAFPPPNELNSAVSSAMFQSLIGS